nr:hypothetical protein Itr_chr01CG07270 [Ipomoea trifida]GLL16944.1 hypothetical protein Itr_chr01CG07300 [Ipomoea trifida]
MLYLFDRLEDVRVGVEVVIGLCPIGRYSWGWRMGGHANGGVYPNKGSSSVEEFARLIRLIGFHFSFTKQLYKLQDTWCDKACLLGDPYPQILRQSAGHWLELFKIILFWCFALSVITLGPRGNPKTASTASSSTLSVNPFGNFNYIESMSKFESSQLPRRNGVSAIWKLSIGPNPIAMTVRRWPAVNCLLASTRSFPNARVCMLGKLSGCGGTWALTGTVPPDREATGAELEGATFRAFDPEHS